MPHVCSSCGGQKIKSDPLEVELQAAVSLPMCCEEPNSHSLEQTVLITIEQSFPLTTKILTSSYLTIYIRINFR